MDPLEGERRRYPLEGIPPDELVAALGVLGASPQFGSPRVLRIDDLGEGRLLIQTGHQTGIRAGAGKYVLLRRAQAGWEIAKVSRWVS